MNHLLWFMGEDLKQIAAIISEISGVTHLLPSLINIQNIQASFAIEYLSEWEKMKHGSILPDGKPKDQEFYQSLLNEQDAIEYIPKIRTMAARKKEVPHLPHFTNRHNGCGSRSLTFF